MKKSREDWTYPVLMGILIVFLLSTYSLTFSKSADPSLYLLSSLAQSQAAVFAIVIGLNSIALQQTATNYSSRVTKIFTEDTKFLWGLFGFSIFYDLILLTVLPNSFERIHYVPVMLAIVFAMFAYNYMVKYIQDKITIFLDPITLISKLSESHNGKGENENDNNINVEIFDFIVGSLNRYDYNSYKKGLSLYYNNKLNNDYINKRINEDSNNEINKETFEDEFNNIVSEFILVGNITSSAKNDVATLYLVDTIFDIFLIFQNKNNERNYFLNTLDQTSEFIAYCTRNELERTTILGITRLYNIFSNIESNIVDQTNMLGALANIGKISSEMKLEKSTSYAITFIDDIIKDIIANKNEINMKLLTKIGVIGLNCAENRLEIPCEKTLAVLFRILIETMNQKEHNITDLTIDIIGKMAILCSSNGFKHCVITTLKSYDTFEEIINKEEESKLNKKKIIRKVEAWKCSIKSSL